MIQSTNIRGAAEVVRSSNPMAMSCGLACPAEQLCAAACTRAKIDTPVEIRRLHRFVTEKEEAIRPRRPVVAPAVGARVAVVGAGPAGLACAFELRRLGLAVTLFDARNRVGGVLSSTIPLYRFPEGAIRRDAAWALGIACGEIAPVELRLANPVTDMEALADEFDAVFVAPGTVAAQPRMAGADLRGVSTAAAFLEKCHRARYRNAVGSEIAVIGGGNVAIDAAMAAVRCVQVRLSQRTRAAAPSVSGDGAAPGSKRRASSRNANATSPGKVGTIPSGNGYTAPPGQRVHLLYRRTKSEMPAWEREVREAEGVGVVIHFLVAPVSFIGKRGRLTGVKLCRATLGPEDASGRPASVPIQGSEFIMPCDQAILATGARIDRKPLGNLPVTKDGFLKANGKTRRVRGNIFAGGDATGADQSIVAAVKDAKLAAKTIAASLGLKQ